MKRRLILTAATAAATSLLGACASPGLELYANEKPVLDLQDYFNGRLDAYGVFTDRSGAVVKRFTVLMQCQWNGDEGVLDEDFLYSDGTRQKRVWRLRKTAPGRFEGRADDVIGVAVGESSGNALRWSYTLRLALTDTTVDVQFDDWMYLMSDQVMLNKATMSKFGVRLGEVTLTFIKR
jgi:hypothetical protein